MYPFLENDDQTVPHGQIRNVTVPLIDPHAPYVGTGMEYQAAHDSGAAIIATVKLYSDAAKVEVRRKRRFA